MIASSACKSQIDWVTNFNDLLHTPFQKKTNAMGWKRNLIGNFEEIVEKVVFDENIKTLTKNELLKLRLTKQGQLARNIILQDFQTLQSYGAKPTLNIIKKYERDTLFPLIPTDVYSFHVDRSPIPTATFLCTYYGASSDILPNAEGQQKILIPEIRNELKKLYDGSEKNFEAFLSEYFFDLHYQALPNAKPINLGVGNLWKLAVDHPQSNVLPCLHRAPVEKKGQSRLLLIC